MTAVSFDPFAGGEIQRVSPTTGPQKEVLSSAKMSEEANTAFNEGVAIHLSGEIDVLLLGKCFDSIVSRHDILRAGFSRNGQDICLYEQKPLQIDYADISSLGPEDQRRAIEQIRLDAVISPMNLEEGPLLHVWLRTIEDSRHILIIAAHHVICDGWSCDPVW